MEIAALRDCQSKADAITANLCFGGTDMRDVWITCSSTGRLYRMRWPRPGLKLAY
jgi:gluconolactonase